MRLLGIDYGDKKVGMAFGESEVQVALPIGTLANDERLIRAIRDKVAAEGADKVIVGVPLSTGEHHDGAQLEKTRSFIALLSEALEIPVEEEDESYTTADSIRLQREEGSEADEDALAAMLILESHMSRL